MLPTNEASTFITDTMEWLTAAFHHQIIVIHITRNMASASKGLNKIKKKFPQQSKRIEALFEMNEDFRTLCADLYLCLQNLEKFKKEFEETRLSMEEYEKTIKEYKSISTELESELSHFIFNEQ